MRNIRELTPISAQSREPLTASLERRRLQANFLLFVGDMLLLAGAFIAVGGLYLDGKFIAFSWKHASISMPIFTVLALYNGTYSTNSLTNRAYSIGRVVLAVLSMAALVLFVTFYNRSSQEFSRALFGLGTMTALIGMSAFRWYFHRTLRRFFGPAIVNTLVIEDNGPETVIPNAFVINAIEHDLTTDMSDPVSLDRFGRYALNMDRIVVSCSVDRREEWATLLRAAGVDGEVVSEKLRELRPLALRKDGDYVSLVVASRPLEFRARAIKRLMDLGVAAAACLFLLPVFVLVFVAIKLDSRGPAFFIQRRMGKGNTFFDMLKFRSMKIEQSDTDGNRSASKDDDRITRVGRFLRKTSLDEIPQLLNVLKGDMSLVGPRPHALGSMAGDKLFWEVDGDYWGRHSLKPGLTGLAQIRGFRGATDEEVDLSRRLSADLEYIANWSPWTDIVIMLKTAKVLVHDRAF